MLILRIASVLILLVTIAHAEEPKSTIHFHINGKEVSEQTYSALLAQLKLNNPPGCKRKAGGGTTFWEAHDASGQRYRVENTTFSTRTTTSKDERITRLR